MPASYRIDVERRMIFSTATGVVTDEDLRGHRERILADPDFGASFDQLWNFQDAAKIDISATAVRQLARARSYEPGVKRAIVTPSDLGYGLARMFQILHDEAPEDLRVFRDLEEAMKWLDLS